MNTSKKINYVYYEIDEKHRNYHGERYFKVDHHGDTVMQIVFHPGDAKRGRTNTIGIYLIARTTFLSNYAAMQYAIPTTEANWKKQHKKIIQYVS